MRSELIINNKEIINWSKPQLLILKHDEDVVVLTNVRYSNETFHGVVVYEAKHIHGLGDFSDSWVKGDFKIFEGTVKLSN